VISPLLNTFPGIITVSPIEAFSSIYFKLIAGCFLVEDDKILAIESQFSCLLANKIMSANSGFVFLAACNFILVFDTINLTELIAYLNFARRNIFILKYVLMCVRNNKIRVNITVDKELVDKAKNKLTLFGGKLSTLFNAYLHEFVKSSKEEPSNRYEILDDKIKELEDKIKKLDKKMRKLKK